MPRLHPLERLMAKVRPDPETGCWLWTGPVDPDGYAERVRVGTHRVAAHKAAYLLLRGKVRKGLHLDHGTCRNRLCVNPWHLEPVTPAENNRRSDVALGIRSAAATCIHGHPFTRANTYRYRGKRQCKACRSEIQRQWRERRRRAA